MAEDTVAQVIVNSLYNAGVRYVFGVPGAKVSLPRDGPERLQY